MKFTAFFLAGLFLSLLSIQAQDDNTGHRFLYPEDFLNNYRLEVFAIIIDAREVKEYKKSRIEGAVNIENMKALEGFADTLDLEMPLYIYCGFEYRSITVADYLKSREFKNIYILQGGIGEWKAVGLPLDKKKRRRKEKVE